MREYTVTVEFYMDVNGVDGEDIAKCEIEELLTRLRPELGATMFNVIDSEETEGQDEEDE